MPKSILNSIKFGHERYAMADAIVRIFIAFDREALAVNLWP